MFTREEEEEEEEEKEILFYVHLHSPQGSNKQKKT